LASLNEEFQQLEEARFHLGTEVDLKSTEPFQCCSKAVRRLFEVRIAPAGSNTINKPGTFNADEQFRFLFPDNLWENSRKTLVAADIFPARPRVRFALQLLRAGRMMQSASTMPGFVSGFFLA